MKIVVTGAAGMIGSNLVHALNREGHDDVIAVDDLTDGRKHVNLAGARLSDYFDRRDFYDRFARGELGPVDVVFHQGACSDTMESDGRLMLDLNYRASKDLLDTCLGSGTRLLYASSAAVYGGSATFREAPEFERPLNVYGPREQHKGRMASVAFHQFGQWEKERRIRLFGAYGGYEAGAQRRDFVFVDDVVAINLWFLNHPEASGIFNVGTGRSQPFNDVALAVATDRRAAEGLGAATLGELVQTETLDYVDFPQALVGQYQCFTEADLGALRNAGCGHAFVDVATGIARYGTWLSAQRPVRV